MAFTSITKPTQGDATKKSLIDLLIDNAEDHESRLAGFGSISGFKNGSFESGAANVPSSWTWTAYSGGDKLMDTTDQQHGDTSFKVISPGGAGNGGGYLETTDFLEVSPLHWYRIEWSMKSSAAAVNNKIEIYWYSAALASISTSIIYDSSSNPTAWTPFSRRARPPATARYGKLRLVGGHTSSSSAGSTWFDNVIVSGRQFEEMIEFTAPGTWTSPITGFARITVIAGGGGSNVNGGGGGGSARSVTAVTAGTDYPVTVGAGGAGGGGATGGSTSSANGVSAAGGFGGSGGAGGAGGAGTGQETFTGETATSSSGAFALLDNIKVYYFGRGGSISGAGNSGKVMIEY